MHAAAASQDSGEHLLLVLALAGGLGSQQLGCLRLLCFRRLHKAQQHDTSERHDGVAAEKRKWVKEGRWKLDFNAIVHPVPSQHHRAARKLAIETRTKNACPRGRVEFPRSNSASEIFAPGAISTRVPVCGDGVQWACCCFAHRRASVSSHFVFAAPFRCCAGPLGLHVPWVSAESLPARCSPVSLWSTKPAPSRRATLTRACLAACRPDQGTSHPLSVLHVIGESRAARLTSVLKVSSLL
jgi:hypothetical protein